MKIAQLVCAWPPYAGGIGNSAFQIGQIISSRYELANFYPDNLKPWLRYGHSAFSPQLLSQLGRFDYIYLHYPFFGASELVWLFKIFNKKTKLIIHYHMDVDFDSPLLKIAAGPAKLLRSSLFKKADKIICSSFDYLKNSSIKDIYQKYPEKFREIPFGVDLEKFKPDILKSEPENPLIAASRNIIKFVSDNFINHHQLSVLFVGGLDRAHYFKGVDKLITAFSRLKDDRFILKICGEGELRPQYEQLASELGIRDKVKFLGKLGGHDLIKAFQGAAVLVLPSINRNEAFGLVLIEALACGTPVIASNLPGVRSVFSDKQEGYLIEPGDISDLQNKIQMILSDEKQRENMSRAARKLAENKYDLRLMANQILGLFD
ncbi:MAG: glycosyltransferase family 4 protein [Patescibacteria group bacterium]